MCPVDSGPLKKKSKIYSSGFYVKFMIEKLAPVPVSFTLDYDAVSSAVIDCVRAEGLQNASKFIDKSHQVETYRDAKQDSFHYRCPSANKPFDGSKSLAIRPPKIVKPRKTEIRDSSIERFRRPPSTRAALPKFSNAKARRLL